MAISINGTPSHDILPGVSTADHHTATVAGDLNLADLAEKDHGSIENKGADDHHDEDHTVASHSDTTGTGAELDSLTDGSEVTLHSHAGKEAALVMGYVGFGDPSFRP